MEKDKHPIVALSRNQISKSVKKTRQHASLLLSLKKTDLELDLYNGLDPEKYNDDGTYPLSDLEKALEEKGFTKES